MSIADRFAAKVEVRGPDECWPWIAKARTREGYGLLAKPGDSTGQGNLRAHRVAWALANGLDPLTLPSSLVVRHIVCDNPPCCNPLHLAAGTVQDNVDDQVRRGTAWWLRMPPPTLRP